MIVIVRVWLDMIGMRTRAPKSNEGKMVNGKETLRLRSKGSATVQEVVSFSGSAGQWLLFQMHSNSTVPSTHTHTCTHERTHTHLIQSIWIVNTWTLSVLCAACFDLRFFSAFNLLKAHVHTLQTWPELKATEDSTRTQTSRKWPLKTKRSSLLTQIF